MLPLAVSLVGWESKNLAMRQAKVAFPTPRGPVIIQAWWTRALLNASRKAVSAVLCPNRDIVSRGCGAPGAQSGSGISPGFSVSMLQLLLEFHLRLSLVIGCH